MNFKKKSLKVIILQKSFTVSYRIIQKIWIIWKNFIQMRRNLKIRFTRIMLILLFLFY